MKIVLLDNENFLDLNSLKLGDDLNIGTVNALFILEEKERQAAIKTCKYIWRMLMKIWQEPSKKSYRSVARFDLIPRVSSPIKIRREGEQIIIEVQIKTLGLYEVNERSPEGPTGVSAVQQARKDLAAFQPSATKRLAEAILESFGEKMKIVLVKGEGFLKNQWGKFFFRDLRKYLPSLKIVTPKEFMEDPPDPNYVVYLYGDYRRQGPAEYSSDFMDFISIHHPREKIFNSIPSDHSEKYISDKSLLLPRGIQPWDSLVGDNQILCEDNIDFALKNQDNLVLKPFLGSSGNEIVMGKLTSQEEWSSVLKEKAGTGKYGVFEARWLPKISLPGLGDFSFDINMAFWAKGSKLKYLYTISRIDKYENYQKNGVINVAKGGGFVGSIIDQEIKI